MSRLVSKETPRASISLTRVAVKGEYTLLKITNLQIAKRLFSMGLLPGSKFKLIRRTRFSNTCYIKAGDFCLALRNKEAASILVR